MAIRASTIFEAFKAGPVIVVYFIVLPISMVIVDIDYQPLLVQILLVVLVLVLILVAVVLTPKYEAWIDVNERRWRFRVMLKKAKQGDVLSQVDAARAYKWGDGVQANAALSAQWLAKAADRGHASSMFDLSECFEKALGVNQDLSESDYLLNLAALRGNSEAHIKLGDKFASGDRVDPDNLRACMWYSRGWDVGDWNAKQRRDVLETAMTNAELEMAKRLFDQDN